MASDSAATYVAGATPTIGQQKIAKIQVLGDNWIFASTGAVGIGQVVASRINEAWRKKVFLNSMKDSGRLMHLIGQEIATTVAPYLQSAPHMKALNEPAPLCKCILSIPVDDTPRLFSFDYNGAPEEASDLSFIALGSGQLLADGFLAFLRKVLWNETMFPTLGEGRLAAIWTLQHVIDSAPGGVSGPIQMAILTSDGKSAAVEMADARRIEEHQELIASAERALGASFDPPQTDKSNNDPPAPPSS